MMPMREVSVQREDWPLKEPFRISGHVFHSEPGILVKIQEIGLVGRGEAQGVYFLGETPDSMAAQILEVKESIEEGASRVDLMDFLPAGGARNAVDAALWDLEAKKTGKKVWELAGQELKEIVTCYTIGLEGEPLEMAEKAAAASRMPLLKVKLDADRPVERVEAIRQVRPEVGLVVDANQGWSFDQLQEIAPRLQDHGALFIEQPLPRGEDEALDGYLSPLPLCADESCLHLGELAQIATRYQMVNIKLDKCGGLTHGLDMAAEARRLGLGLMVGCMCGTSLAMAPAFVLGLACDFHDLDGPLLIEGDRDPAMTYTRGIVGPPSPALWG